MHSYIGYIHMCYAPMYHLSLVEQCQHTPEIRKKNEIREVESNTYSCN